MNLAEDIVRKGLDAKVLIPLTGRMFYEYVLDIYSYCIKTSQSPQRVVCFMNKGAHFTRLKGVLMSQSP